MKKILFLFPILLIVSGCGWFGNSDNTGCVSSCLQTLSTVCSENQTEVCSTICEESDNELRNCLMAVEDCEDLEEQATVCYSRPEFADTGSDDSGSQVPSCPSVCEKYQECAAFGDDVTDEDLTEAYESCMIECPGWSSEGLTCMDSVEINVPLDCMPLSVCGAQEYSNF